MGGGQTDHDKVDLMLDAKLAHRLTTVEVIADQGEAVRPKEPMLLAGGDNHRQNRPVGGAHLTRLVGAMGALLAVELV